MGLAFMSVVSCSDDDNDNNTGTSSSIVYQNQAFDKAYTLEEGRSAIVALRKTFIGSEGIDTVQLKQFVSACRYFNDTYLIYKSHDGQVPFDSILSKVQKFLSGDLSGIPATLDRYKALEGSYTANTATKTWDKVGSMDDGIALTFNDANNKAMKATLGWVSPKSTSFSGVTTQQLNIIKIKDRLGNLVNDTLPSLLTLEIKGGSDNIYFRSTVQLYVANEKFVDISSVTFLGEYGIRLTHQITNSLDVKNIQLYKGDALLLDIAKRAEGNNLVKSLVDPVAYPVTNHKSVTLYNFSGKFGVRYLKNEKAITDKRRELIASGVLPGSKAFAETMSELKTKENKNMYYSITDNAFIGTVSPKPVNVTADKWASVPFITLHNGSTYSLTQFDNSGGILYFFSKVQTLLERLGMLTGMDSEE